MAFGGLPVADIQADGWKLPDPPGMFSLGFERGPTVVAGMMGMWLVNPPQPGMATGGTGMSCG